MHSHSQAIELLDTMQPVTTQTIAVQDIEVALLCVHGLDAHARVVLVDVWTDLVLGGRRRCAPGEFDLAVAIVNAMIASRA